MGTTFSGSDVAMDCEAAITGACHLFTGGEFNNNRLATVQRYCVESNDDKAVWIQERTVGEEGYVQIKPEHAFKEPIEITSTPCTSARTRMSMSTTHERTHRHEHEHHARLRRRCRMLLVLQLATAKSAC